MTARLAIRVQPRARTTEVAGERAGAVVLRVAAPPVGGKANAEVRAFLARRAGVPKSAVTIVRGAGARDKVVEVDGVEPAALREALGLDG